MKISDIPQLRHANYIVDIPLGSFKKTLADHIADGLDTDPDFQRPHVWTEQQQIEFIEFILSGGRDVRALTIQTNQHGFQHKATNKYTDFVLVDGKQRLKAITRFLDNEIGVFGNHKLDDFEDKAALLRHYTIKFAVNELPSKDEVLKWYLQINAGGTIHTPTEIEKVKGMITDGQ